MELQDVLSRGGFYLPISLCRASCQDFEGLDLINLVSPSLEGVVNVPLPFTLSLRPSAFKVLLRAAQSHAAFFWASRLFFILFPPP